MTGLRKAVFHKEQTMIIVDGRENELKISNFSNLEEILEAIMQQEGMTDRVITDILVNNENFSEIYPHQAEDLATDSINSIEVKSVETDKMAVEVAAELDKVSRMMENGAKNCARLFRESKDSEALELLQDLLDVTRDFMGTLTHLKDQYLGGADEEFMRKTDTLSNLLTEMSEVLENEDWILLADLLEYEFVPQCEEWRNVGDLIHRQLQRKAKKA